MKHFLFSLVLLLGTTTAISAQNHVPTPENMANRRAFAADRFGIFIHWGLYSLFAQGEWYMQNAKIDHREYAKSMNAFYPHAFDADEWAGIIKESGARYVTFTTRHHDGFSMWHTGQSDYNISQTPYRRDIVGQLAEACRRHGLALHLYYSHIDWTRDDYPTGRTGRHTGKNPKLENWAQYYNFMNAQLSELLTQYGPVRAVWFDGWWDHDRDSIPFDWQLPEQYALIHRLQPACLVGNNHHQTPHDGEDFQIFERDVPGENKAGMSGQSISRLPLETCETMNGMWGYKVIDQNYKTTTQLIRLLARTAAKGANLLLNVGPQPDGLLPATAVERLREMGQWLKTNGAAIYDTRAGTLTAGENVVSTRRGKTLYLHVLDDTLSTVSLACDLPVKSVKAFDTGEKVAFTLRNGNLAFAFAPQKGNPDRIFEITLK